MYRQQYTNHNNMHANTDPLDRGKKEVDSQNNTKQKTAST